MSSGRGRGLRGGGRGGRGGKAAQSTQPNQSLALRLASAKPVQDMRVKEVEDQIQESIKSAKTTDLSTLPLRPGYGTKGMQILLWTNHFELTGLGDLAVYRYAVDVAPDRNGRAPGRKRQRRIVQLMIEDHFADQKLNITTDFSSNMISNISLKLQNPYQVQYREEGDDVQANAVVYQVSVQPTGVMQLSDLLGYVTSTSGTAALDSKEELLHILNIIIGHYPKAVPEITLVGANKYYSIEQQSTAFAGTPLGAGLNAMRGLFTSARAATARILINAQIKHCAFYEAGPLDMLITNYQNANGPNKAKLEAFLKKLTVNTTHLKRRNRAGQEVFRMRQIQALASPRDGEGQAHRPLVSEHGAGPMNVKFWLEDENTYISVFDFFKKAYNIVIKNTKMPVLNVGNKQKPVYIPAQVCQVPEGQHASTKLSPRQTSAMIGFAVRPPTENKDWIAHSGASLVGLVPANQTLNAFGLKVSPELLAVPARILDGPKVMYSGNKQIIPSFGSWNLRQVRFSGSAQLTNWTYLSIHMGGRPLPWANQDKLKQAVGKFEAKMREVGMRVSPAAGGLSISVTPATAESEINRAINIFTGTNNRPPPQLILVFLPNKDTAIYNQVKYTCDVKAGLLNVCVTEKFFNDNNDQYFANVCLKVNLKLGGRNHSLESHKLGIIAEGKTMVVGLDVTHPSPGSAPNAPSVAAVVASVDRMLGQFPAELLILPRRKEMITGLKEMIKTRLVLWQKHNGSLPDNILVYRDGVSEGEYAKVLGQEVPLFREAGKDLYPADRTKAGFPRITVIVVGKRHHTRFYPTRPDDGDRNMNPKNGTVVDRGVTEARNWDFFLLAHTAVKGTARPAHYYIVLDEIFRRAAAPGGGAGAGAGRGRGRGRGTGGTAGGAVGSTTRQQQAQPQNVADVVEDLTHSLCYTFGRATKAVSICPPAYYADLACERARCYLSQFFDPDSVERSSTTSTTGTGAEPDKTPLGVHENVKNAMFYI
ncbi:hypothetical protein PV08_09391 [Exophiala spinifera]|uniref:Piwi domain-containing protein n=1 Tax=Exophiala spinifera TaxID=91928 RepID=A0A0D1ZGM0_9EURO|nr:uncharacterized protein PV08_09391 [Exophiala spinifera]KIW12117.1 hypothetical protein PV08_09391 [Exophiala spinifera]